MVITDPNSNNNNITHESQFRINDIHDPQFLDLWETKSWVYLQKYNSDYPSFQPHAMLAKYRQGASNDIHEGQHAPTFPLVSWLSQWS